MYFSSPEDKSVVCRNKVIRRTIVISTSSGISVGKSNGREIPEEDFPKYLLYLARLSTLSEIQKTLLHSSLEIGGNPSQEELEMDWKAPNEDTTGKRRFFLKAS